MAEELESAWSAELPADALHVHGVFADEQRLHFGELTMTAGTAIALAQAGDAFIGVDLNNDARETGVGTECVTKRGFDRDEGGSPANVGDLHRVSEAVSVDCRAVAPSRRRTRDRYAIG